MAQRLEADRLVEGGRLLREHRAQRRVALHSAFEGLLLLLDSLHHVLDDVLVLAAQAPKLGELLLDAGDARVENRAHVRGEHANLVPGRGTDDVPFRRDELLRQRLLELRQPALRQQRIIAVDLREQRFLRRDREHLRGRDAEDLRRALDLTGDLGVDLGGGLELVPEPVDLVQHDQPALAAGRVGSDQVVLPDVDVGAGDPGVRRQDEQDRVRVGQQVQGQFGLGADRVQTGRVEDHKPLLQKRMREIDDRMAPARDVDRAFVRRGQRGEHVAIVVETVLAREGYRYPLCLRYLREHLAHLVRRGQVERERDPLVGVVLEFGNRTVARARFDRKQADRRRARRIVQELGRTHGRAARR